MARWRSAGSTGSIGIRTLQLGGCGDEVGEDAPQLDAGAIGAHVDLGGDVEREPPVDVLLLEQRGPRRGSSARTRRRRRAGRRRRGRRGAARCRRGSARRPPAARRSRARWCRRPARSRSADSPGTGRGTRSAGHAAAAADGRPAATPGSSWLGNQWVLVTVMPNPSRSTVDLGHLEPRRRCRSSRRARTGSARGRGSCRA